MCSALVLARRCARLTGLLDRRRIGRVPFFTLASLTLTPLRVIRTPRRVPACRPPDWAFHHPDSALTPPRAPHPRQLVDAQPPPPARRLPMPDPERGQVMTPTEVHRQHVLDTTPWFLHTR